MRAAELGIGVHEMKSYVAQDDVEQWLPLVQWLARPRGAPGAPQLPPQAGPAAGGSSPGDVPPALPMTGQTAATGQAAEDGAVPAPAVVAIA